MPLLTISSLWLIRVQLILKASVDGHDNKMLFKLSRICDTIFLIWWIIYYKYLYFIILQNLYFVGYTSYLGIYSKISNYRIKIPQQSNFQFNTFVCRINHLVFHHIILHIPSIYQNLGSEYEKNNIKYTIHINKYINTSLFSFRSLYT